jgi:hypothetical protein
MQVGGGHAHIVEEEYPNGHSRIVEFKPEQVSQFPFRATLFPKTPRSSVLNGGQTELLVSLHFPI